MGTALEEVPIDMPMAIHVGAGSPDKDHIVVAAPEHEPVLTGVRDGM
jgi:hypothetical protein